MSKEEWQGQSFIMCFKKETAVNMSLWEDFL